MDTKYRLEVKFEGLEIQWHYEIESDNAIKENTFGWRTLAKSQPSLKLSSFTNYMRKYYPKVKFEEAKKLWDFFDYTWRRKYAPNSDSIIDEAGENIIK